MDYINDNNYDHQLDYELKQYLFRGSFEHVLAEVEFEEALKIHLRISVLNNL